MYWSKEEKAMLSVFALEVHAKCRRAIKHLHTVFAPLQIDAIINVTERKKRRYVASMPNTIYDRNQRREKEILL